jgi:hypothetical protein
VLPIDSSSCLNLQMTYSRIERSEDIPPPGPLSLRAREKRDLDFKSFADPRHMAEHAKDLAAFANALGGVILLGADDKTKPGRLSYPGVRGQTVSDVKDIYEKAGQLCSPPVAPDVVPIAGHGATLVAVNIDPVVEQLVASPAADSGWSIVSDAWKFPVRHASQTDFIDPKDAALHMDRTVRRAFLLLARIPADRRQEVKFYCRNIAGGAASMVAAERVFRLEGVPDGRNHLVIADRDWRGRVPLADVVDVWESAEGFWAVKVRGAITRRMVGTDNMIDYLPLFDG